MRKRRDFSDIIRGMKTFSIHLRLFALCLTAATVMGCSVFGIARRAPMVEIRDVTVQDCDDLTPIIVRAATE